MLYDSILEHSILGTFGVRHAADQLAALIHWLSPARCLARATGARITWHQTLGRERAGQQLYTHIYIYIYTCVYCIYLHNAY